MKRITESQGIKLAKLKFRNPEQYQERLDTLGIKETDVKDFIDKEESRIESISQIHKAVFEIHQTIHSDVFYPGKNSPLTYSISKAIRPRKKTYIMIDGDNHPFSNMDGYRMAKNRAEIAIVVFVADPGLADRYRKDYGVEIQIVTPGNQAVDNQIKAIAGNKAKNHEYDELIIISSDQGYRKKIKEWKQKYQWDNQRIRLCKSIKSALSGSNNML